MAFYDRTAGGKRQNIAVVGSGVSGLSAAWLLAQNHDFAVFEATDRIGGRSTTVLFESVGGLVAVDTGFIVYNDITYPNLTALFRTLDVPTAVSNISFAVHEDGIQAGLAVAEELGGVRRPWQLAQESARIVRESLIRPVELPMALEVLA